MVDIGEASSHGEAQKLEITPKTADRIRDVVVKSAFVQGATPEMVKDVSRIEPMNYKDTFLVETTTGLDAIVCRVPDTFPVDDDWSNTQHDDGFYLEGFFEEKTRTIKTPDGVFFVHVFTGPDRFNRAMVILGRQPGTDSFRLVPKEVGEFTARVYAESAARLEVPIARQSEEFVEHDLTLSDHIQGWWSMPTEVALRLQKRAKEVVASGDEARIVEFSDGLDILATFSNRIVPFFSDLLDNEWSKTDSIDEKVEHAMNYIKNFSDPLGDAYDHWKKPPINLACIGLMETGLIKPVSIESDPDDDSKKIKWPADKAGNVNTHSLELLRAKHEMIMLAGAYARNIVSMLSRASEHQGIAQKAEPKRGQLIERLMTRLEPDAVATFINQNQSPN